MEPQIKNAICYLSQPEVLNQPTLTAHKQVLIKMLEFYTSKSHVEYIQDEHSKSKGSPIRQMMESEKLANEPIGNDPEIFHQYDQSSILMQE